ncbi:MAG: oligosaccharide flippase family protein [Hylemonella sp.]
MLTKSLLSGSVVYLAANVLSAMLPFALLPVLTRYLNPEEYGVIAMFQALVIGLGAFVGLGVAGAAGRKYYDDHPGKDELRDFIGACMQVTLMSGLLTLVGVVLLRSQVMDWLGLDIDWLVLAVFVAAATVVVQIRLGQWQVRKEAFHYATLQVSQSAFAVALSILLVIVFSMGERGRIWALIVAACLAALVSWRLLLRDGLLRLGGWSSSHMRDALSFGLPLIPHVLGGFMLASADRLVINASLGLSETGLYTVAVQLVSVMGLVFSAINNAYVPWLFERLKNGVETEKHRIVRYTYVWFGLIILSVGLAFAAGPWLVVLIAGEQYEAAGDVIGWLALSQAFGGMYLMVTNYIFYSKRTAYLAFSTLLSGLLNVALLVPLVNGHGLKGAAAASCIASGVQFGVTWWLASRLHPMPWFRFGFWK